METHGPPDGVILDLCVPGDLDGRAFLAWLRGRPGLEAVPVVVTTGLPLDRTGDLAGRPGVRVLQKSSPFDALLDAFADLGLELRKGN